MKKLYLIIIVVIMIISSSCTTDQIPAKLSHEYASFIIDMANDGIVKNAEKEWWLGVSYTDTSVDNNKQIEIENLERILQYDSSYYPKYSNTPVNRYRDDELQVLYDSVDNRIRGIHYTRLISDNYFKKEDVPNSFEYTRNAAQKIASQYIDLDSYQLEYSTNTITDPNNNNQNVTLYTFNYVKYVGNFITTDRIYIQFTSKGDFRTLNIGTIGLFDKVDLSNIVQPSINESINQKLGSIYSNLGEYSYSIVEQTLAYTPDGQLCIVSRIELDIYLDNGLSYSTGVVLATVID